MPSPRGLLLPAYVVADESQSMKPVEHELNAGLASLFESLRSDPMIAGKLRLAVLGFSKTVEQRLALCDVREQSAPPTLSIRGETSYAAVFSDLLARIPQDVGELKRAGYDVHRPAVFFLSDGAPTDKSPEDWQDPRRRLVDKQANPIAPNIVSIGVGDADASTMLEVATDRNIAFISIPGVDVGAAISKFFSMLTASLVASSRSLATDTPTLAVPKADQEHFRLAIDVI